MFDLHARQDGVPWRLVGSTNYAMFWLSEVKSLHAQPQENEMPGKPGRSGGARPGAGRPKKDLAVSSYTDPLDFLRAVWTGELEATVAQVRAATSALPFIHQKLGEGGKKDQKQAAAEKVATGKFGLRAVK
jgi:hypothetical protein